jgi:hypothetical protein
MTLPPERTYALNNAREFLRDLLDPKKTPRIPSLIRQRARGVLKHYPTEYDVERITEKCPEIIGKTKR